VCSLLIVLQCSDEHAVSVFTVQLRSLPTNQPTKQLTKGGLLRKVQDVNCSVDSILLTKRIAVIGEESLVNCITTHSDRQGRRWMVRRERQRAYSKRLNLTGSRRHVTVDAQKRPKLDSRRPWWSLVSAGNVQKQIAYSKRLKLTGSRGHAMVDAQKHIKLGRFLMCRSI
jgi:hypothetical protein